MRSCIYILYLGIYFENIQYQNTSGPTSLDRNSLIVISLVHSLKRTVYSDCSIFHILLLHISFSNEYANHGARGPSWRNVVLQRSKLVISWYIGVINYQGRKDWWQLNNPEICAEIVFIVEGPQTCWWLCAIVKPTLERLSRLVASFSPSVFMSYLIYVSVTAREISHTNAD